MRHSWGNTHLKEGARFDQLLYHLRPSQVHLCLFEKAHVMTFAAGPLTRPRIRQHGSQCFLVIFWISFVALVQLFHVIIVGYLIAPFCGNIKTVVSDFPITLVAIFIRIERARFLTALLADRFAFPACPHYRHLLECYYPLHFTCASSVILPQLSNGHFK